MNKDKLIKSLKYFLGWPISVISLVFIVKIIYPTFSSVWGDLLSVNIPVLILGILIFQLYYFFRSLVWQKMINGKGHNLGFIETAFFWELSEIKRFTPGNIWSFLAKTFSFEKKGVEKKQLISCMVYEALLVIISALIVSLISIPFLLDISNIVHKELVFYLFAFIVFISAILFIFGSTIRGKINNKVGKLLAIFPDYSPTFNFELLLIYVFGMSAFGLASYFTGTAFIYLNLANVLIFSSIFVFALVVGYLSFITPMGLGVREGIILFSLAPLIGPAAAGIVSIVTRIFLIISELFYLLIVYIVRLIKTESLNRMESFVSKNKYLISLAFTNLCYITYFLIASILRHNNFYTGRFDLGNMDQTVWSTLNGVFFSLTNPNGMETVSRLSFHSDFILILLSPFYLIWSDPQTLLAIQTIVLSLGSVFIYLIAKKVIKKENIALVLAIAYLLNPAIAYVNLYDFHAVALATTFLLASFYFILKRRYLWFTLFAILAALCKEQVWLIVALMGLFVFIKEQREKKKNILPRLMGILLFTFSSAIFYYLIWYAIPAIRGGTEHFALSYYSEFGDSPSSVARNILFSPLNVVSLLTEESRMEYLQILLFPLGYLSIFSPLYLIFALPDFAVNFLSNNVQLRQIYYQYSSTITPFIFISAIYGIRFIKNRINKTTPIIIYLLITTFISFYFYSPFPGALHANIDMFVKPVNNKDAINQVLKAIPQEASVAASNNLGAHVSHREKIFTVPIGTESADFVVLLLNDGYAQPSLQRQKEIAFELFQNPNYRILIKDGDFVAFEKIEN